MSAAAFASQFSRVSGGVRRWMALRAAFTGVGYGVCVGAAVAAVAWALRVPVSRAAIAVVGGLSGAAVAVLLARWRAFSDEEMALYLDHRLGAGEAIVTALPLASGRSPAAGAPLDVVVRRATEALETAAPRATRPRLWHARQLALVVGVALALIVSRIAPRPTPPAPQPTPGSEIVRTVDTPELDRALVALSAATPKDAEQQRRLRELTEKAEALRAALQRGAPRREVQAELGELADGIAVEQPGLGRGDEREGFEAALAKLAEAGLEGPRSSLAEQDPGKLDDELARLANQTDPKAREGAKRALADAAKAARDAGASDVANALDERATRFARQEKDAEQLRALASSSLDKLPDAAKRELEKMNQSGDPEAEKQVAEAVAKVLSSLSAEERKKLVEQLEKQASAASQAGKEQPADQQAAGEMARALASEAGREALEQAMRELGQGSPKSTDAARAEALATAADALGKLKQELSGAAGEAGQEAGAPGAGPGLPGEGPKAPGLKRPTRLTPGLASSSLPLRASASVGGGATLPKTTVGRTRSRPGETANARGSGELGNVGPEEIGGVSKSDVPEEYREQVGRYFQP